jgi:ribonuclease HI
MAAAANALHKLLAMRAIPLGSDVKIICDNNSVVRYIKRSGCKAKGMSAAQTIPAYEYFAGLAKRAGLKVTAQWVRAHQKENLADQDITMNRRADKLAGKHSGVLHQQRIAAAKAMASTEEERPCFA